MKGLYWILAHVGFMVTPAAVILGFRHDPYAPAVNCLYNALIYGAFAALHLSMTRPWFKRIIAGQPEGSPGERRIYVTVSIVTWLLVYAVHLPVPGPGWAGPLWLQYLGLCGLLLGLFAFVEGTTFQVTSGLLGVPGTVLSHSHGSETPLMTEGSYASVRHPMYRGFMFLLLGGLVVHPTAGQLLWSVMIFGTFLVFIPIEERQLLEHRGAEYRAYMERTPYRILQGVW
jgi:protein-S-isoprenylcysteine O-methyltransferase Ste14